MDGGNDGHEDLFVEIFLLAVEYYYAPHRWRARGTGSTRRGLMSRGMCFHSVCVTLCLETLKSFRIKAKAEKVSA